MSTNEAASTNLDPENNMYDGVVLFKDDNNNFGESERTYGKKKRRMLGKMAWGSMIQRRSMLKMSNAFKNARRNWGFTSQTYESGLGVGIGRGRRVLQQRSMDVRRDIRHIGRPRSVQVNKITKRGRSFENKTALQKEQIAEKKLHIFKQKGIFNKLQNKLLTLAQEYPNTEVLKNKIISANNHAFAIRRAQEQQGKSFIEEEQRASLFLDKKARLQMAIKQERLRLEQERIRNRQSHNELIRMKKERDMLTTKLRKKEEKHMNMTRKIEQMRNVEKEYLARINRVEGLDEDGLLDEV